MNKKRFWKVFVVVFIIAFVVNVMVASVWSKIFPGSSWSWNTGTTAVLILAIVIAYDRSRDGKK